MKVSLAWLQKYFAEPLPDTDALVDALTFHSCEVEEVLGEGDRTVLDVKVLPDRAPYALSHRGIALEIAAALDRTLVNDPLRSPLPEPTASAATVTVSIEDSTACPRYVAARVTGVKVGPSPEWLKTALETVGQRSINNVVDATNYVMLNIGQPLHAFDAQKLAKDSDGAIGIQVRGSKEGERITSLTGEEYTLPVGTLLITDAVNGAALGIAGVKGGKAAELTTETTDIIIESANFEGTAIRKTSQALKLWTDASLRFQNKISAELAAYGMRDVVALIVELAGGELQGIVDTYPTPEASRARVTTTGTAINGLLGTTFSLDELSRALTRLTIDHAIDGDQITITPPFERRDLVIWQDVAEEIGRILGYEHIVPAALPVLTTGPNQKTFAGIEAIKDLLTERGFIEISTQAFAETGAIQLENPLQADKPWLRASLSANMQDALTRASFVAPRVLGPETSLKLFELGNIFTKDGEFLSLSLGYRAVSGKKSTTVLSEALDALTSAFSSAGISGATAVTSVVQGGVSQEGAGDVVEISLKEVDLNSIGENARLARIALGTYHAFSLYPSALRDIAVWTPSGTEESQVALLIEQQAGDLLARMDLFDRFEKGGRISYAFRLVFQANDRTLADTDIDPLMERITDTLNAQDGWEVR